MKEFAGTASNIAHILLDDGTLTARAEIVIIWAEPYYSFDAAGQMNRQRRVGEYRISASAKGLRDLADQFVQTADSMDEEAARVSATQDVAQEAGR